MSSPINNARKALSLNFDNLVECLVPMGYSHIAHWNNEEDYLNILYHRAQSSTHLFKNLVFATSRSQYAIRINCEKVHKKIKVKFPSKQKFKPCEIGDIFLVSKYVDPKGIMSRNVSFIQVKVSNKRRRTDVWKIAENQLFFYKNWPTILDCYAGVGKNKKSIIKNLKITHANRLFSPYMLLGRNCHPGLSCGPYPWITGTDLVSIALEKDGKMRGPLEVAFLYFLVQLIFQVNGERDIQDYQDYNLNLKALTDGLLRYMHINDPPKGEGKPFVVITFTIKRLE